jgi:energy-coupling factor transporter ATP-binding protein EcfA2
VVQVSVGPPGAELVVRNLTLEVGAGEWLGITGANGSGKTTVALALAGLAPVQSGRILIDGAPLAPGSPTRTRVAAILQEPGSQLLTDRVIDEVALTARNLGTPRDQAIERAVQIADRLGIRELEQNPAALSVGRQQVVLLAAALVSKPSVLVADEALAHVDATSRADLLSLLREEVGSGLTLVWVTQSADELSRADRALELTRAGLIQWRKQPSQGPREAGAVIFVPAIGRVRITPNKQNRSRIRVNHEVDLPIPGTGVVLVTGANGAGKSTLLECIAGALDQPEVEVLWGTQTSGAKSKPKGEFGPLLVGERPETQIVHEQVEDELCHAAVARGMARAEALDLACELLKTLPLGAELMSRRTWSLSLGEKRVVLSVGAMIAPAVLLALDEPTAGLDEARSEFMANLVQRRATNGPVFVASQDTEWMAKVGGERFDLGNAQLD